MTLKNFVYKTWCTCLIFLLVFNFLAPIKKTYAQNFQGSWVTENNRMFTTVKPSIEWKSDTEQKEYKLIYSLKSNFSDEESTGWIISSNTFHQFDDLSDNTYFVRLFIRDTNDNEAQIKDILSFTVDTALPQGGFIINQDDQYTTTAQVTLNLNAQDLNGVSYMSVKNLEDSQWSDWTYYQETYLWNLGNTAGKKTVNVRFMDIAGNISQTYSDTIILKEISDFAITDTKYHWGKNEIETLVRMGIITGYPDNTFKPDNNILRGEFIKIVVSSIGLEPVKGDNLTFEELQNHWVRPYVEAAVKEEIIKASDYQNGFNPNEYITREEITKIIVRALGRDNEAKAVQNAFLDFTDANQIKFKGYVKIAGELGIINGFPNGTFAPTAQATRAEAAVIVTRMIYVKSGKPLQEITKSNLKEVSIDYDKVNTSMLNLLTVKVIDENNNEVIIDDDRVIFDSADNYSDIEGVTCFRGNNYRNSASYGTAEIKENKLEVIWDVPISRIDGWTGVGWNGQPAIVKWSDKVKQNMNIYDSKKNKNDLKEVIYGTLDGNVYFLDLENGEYTRKPINLAAPIKGSVSIDPRGIPLLYVGQGIDKVNEEKVEIGYRIYSLIDQKKLYFINGIDRFAYRGWGAFDSTAIVDKHTDTMVVGGENGILYKVKLNSNYNIQDGTISIDPKTVRYRYWKNGNKYQGIENSVATYRNLAYFADNGGWLQCINLNTMKPVWVQNVTDDTDSTIVLDEEQDGVSIYTACQVDKQGEEGFSYIRKINALTGNIVWKRPYKAISKIRENRSASNGGAFATPVVGKNQLDNLIIYNLARCEEIEKGKIVALDKHTGKEVWTLNLKNYSWSSPVDVYTKEGKGYIIVCNSAGIMYLLDGLTGAVLDKIYLGSNIEGSPAVYDDIIVVGTRGQKIFGVKIK